MSHRCPSPGCEKRVPSSMFSCRAHWYSIPKPLRDRLWHAYRNHGVISDEYAAAADACESFLEAEDAVEPVAEEAGKPREERGA